jgi:hypothetical protein
MAEKTSKRTWVVDEPLVEGPGGELLVGERFNMERAHELMGNLLGTLAEIGGMVFITVDRVMVGEGPGGEALAESRKLIVEWQAFAPLRKDEDAGSEAPGLAKLAEQAHEVEVPGEGDDLGGRRRGGRGRARHRRRARGRVARRRRGVSRGDRGPRGSRRARVRQDVLGARHRAAHQAGGPRARR